jgi:hypothetical protein
MREFLGEFLQGSEKWWEKVPLALPGLVWGAPSAQSMPRQFTKF